MAAENVKKVKFDRNYMGYNPNRLKGPPVNVLGTVVKPIPKPEAP